MSILELLEPPVRVNLSERSYPIWIGSGILDRFSELIGEGLDRVSHAFCLCDSSVRSPFGTLVMDSLQQGGIRVSSMEIPSGEGSKSPGQLVAIWDRMLEERCDRSSVVIAIGGGVVGDLAGFAAASYARGLRLIQVPTTLLSQVDSSVGGKTGINLPKAKNMVGAFWQPSVVAIDLQTLTTLPKREYVSGLAEVVKYGVIMDAPFFDWLELHAASIVNRSDKELAYLIRRSCECKAEVVIADERETTGRRAILNYGHTFAHAIEAATEYGQLLHGEAVSIGMTMAARLAVRLGRVADAFLQRQTKLLEAMALPVRWDRNEPEELWKLMQSDKKVHHGTLNFILPSGFGKVESVPNVEAKDVLKTLQDCR